MKIIFEIIYYICIGIIVSIVILLLVSTLPIPGGFKVLAVLSGSMAPEIKTGSVVVVKPENNYQVGDAVTFGKISKTQTPTTHRIVEIKDDAGQQVFVTKGDANNAADTKEISKREIIGKVLFSVPYVGYAINAAKKPVGFVLIIIVPVALIIFDEIKNIKNEVVKIRKKNKQTKYEGTV